MHRKATVFLCFAVSLCLTCLYLTPAAPAAQSAPVNNLALLSGADVALYRQAIAAERAGQFARAKRAEARIEDPSLLGYLSAEHMLSPHSGRTPLTKLVHWLRRYGDLPIAKRIHTLAVRRATKTVLRHHRRVRVRTAAIPGLPRVPHRGGGYEDASSARSSVQSAAAKRALRQIRIAIRDDKPERAEALLKKLETSGRAPEADIAVLSRLVCTSYLIEGRNTDAYALGTVAAEAGRGDAPLLDWYTGLAAFQLHLYAEAAQHFDVLRRNEDMPDSLRAAAAFWTARAEMRNGHPGPVVALLQQAADFEPTFYGLLSESLLGEDPEAKFTDPMPQAAALNAVLSVPAARRAVALRQIGEAKYAKYINAELNRAYCESDDAALDVAYAYLARQLGVTNVELRASETAAAQGIKLTGLFPVPPYQPRGGYTIDSGLVLAFARIETRFQAHATSPAGAVGLMQLMPATARIIGGRKATRKALRDPAYNMTLGERYIARMLDAFDGNLIKLAAAYNAGPGKVIRWQEARQGGEDDPLIFLETMRAPETRHYVKKLLTYYWMYHRRQGDAAPSLKEAASGEWPNYHPPAQTAPPPPEPSDDEDDDEDDAVPVS